MPCQKGSNSSGKAKFGYGTTEPFTGLLLGALWAYSDDFFLIFRGKVTALNEHTKVHPPGGMTLLSFVGCVVLAPRCATATKFPGRKFEWKVSSAGGQGQQIIIICHKKGENLPVHSWRRIPAGDAFFWVVQRKGGGSREGRGTRLIRSAMGICVPELRATKTDGRRTGTPRRTTALFIAEAKNKKWTLFWGRRHWTGWDRKGGRIGGQRLFWSRCRLYYCISGRWGRAGGRRT